MSKSKYRPHNMGFKKLPRKLAQAQHRARLRNYLKQLLNGKLDYDHQSVPSEILRKKFFSDWYW